MLVPEAEVIVTVAGISEGNTTLNMQFLSIGKLSQNPTTKLDYSFTIVMESARPSTGLSNVANSVAYTDSAPV